MLLAYVDESGDSGYGGSRTYTLGCVLVEAEDWPDAFDRMVAFRRFLRDKFRIRMRDEVKANYLVRGTGSLQNLQLGDRIRRDIYTLHMRVLHKVHCQAFAVVIQKEKIIDHRKDPRELSWNYLVQRFERIGSKDQRPVMVIHDEGDATRVRTLIRRARRFNIPGSAFGDSGTNFPARLLVDDPVPRNSTQSYFIQLADLTAYAAYRKLYPPPHQDSVCPQNMWDELGAAAYARANQLKGPTSGSPPGIVRWPG